MRGLEQGSPEKNVALGPVRGVSSLSSGQLKALGFPDGWKETNTNRFNQGLGKFHQDGWTEGSLCHYPLWLLLEEKDTPIPAGIPSEIRSGS